MRIRPLGTVAAAALVAGLGVAAVAEKPVVHVLRVALPGGGVEEVHYLGDTPPRVLVAAPAADPLDMAFGGDPFAGFDRVAAVMDAQLAALMHQAAAMQVQPAAGPGISRGSDVQLAALADAPAGARYSYTSTTVVNGRACTTSVQATSAGAGKPPQLLRRVSGDGCAAATGPAGPTPAAAPVPPNPPAPPRLVSAPAAPRAPLAPRPPAPPAAPKPPAPDTI